jgi:hypothetical protein
MDPTISLALIGLCCLAPVALFAAHVLASRYAGRRPEKSSPQLLLVRLILVFNVPVLAATWLIARHEGRDALETAYMLVFAFLVFNGVAYAYFHFFNMSETARRIRMLLQIRHAGADGLRVQDLERAYSPRDMIEARLDRLVKMRQLALGPDGRYRIAGRLLLRAGKAMSLWRRLVFHRVLDNRQ